MKVNKLMQAFPFLVFKEKQNDYLIFLLIFAVYVFVFAHRRIHSKDDRKRIKPTEISFERTDIVMKLLN